MAWIGLASVSERNGYLLELLTDPDILLMFERGIQGGITQAVHRYAKASNRYTADPEGESSFLQYLDANNLYGWAMIQKLPTGGFNWVDAGEFTPDKIDSYANCDSARVICLRLMLSIPKNYMIRIMTFRLCVKRW